MEFNYATYSDSPLKSIMDTKDQIVQDVLVKSVLDPMYFAKTFFPDTFEDPMTYQHVEYWDILADETIPRAAICAWRKFGKTTNVWAKVIWNTVFRRSPFTMWVASEADIAEEQLDGVKEMLIDNADLRECFGNLRPQRMSSSANKSFSKKGWYVVDPQTNEAFAYFLPKGMNQKVRGVNVVVNGRKTRPTLIFIDDLEDDQEVLNEELREKMRKWFNRSLIPCVGRHEPDAKTERWLRPENDPFWSPPWRVIYTDSFKHEDAIMSHILQSKGWVTRRFPKAEQRPDSAGDLRWHSLVPEVVSTEKVRRDISNAKANGIFDEWCYENLCIPGSSDNCPWKQNTFQYYRERTNEFVGAEGAGMGMRRDIKTDRDVHRFVIVDPARSPNPRSAYTAMLAVAYDPMTGNIYLRDIINAKLSMEDIVYKSFEMARATNSTAICPEITGLNEWIQHPFMDECISGNHNVELFWLKATDAIMRSGNYGKGKEAAKRARASTLIPYYNKRRVWHEEILRNSALEQQMLSFPRPAKWDALDCAGYIPYILMSAQWFAHPQVIKATDENGVEVRADAHHRLGKVIASGSWRTC